MLDTNRKFAIITVDTNHANYVSNTIEITEEQALVLARVANAIKTFEPYDVEDDGMTWKHDNNFPTGEMCREDLGQKTARDYYVKKKKTITSEDFNVFMDLTPYSEYGFHTVTEIKILAVIGEIKLL